MAIPALAGCGDSAPTVPAGELPADLQAAAKELARTGHQVEGRSVTGAGIPVLIVDADSQSPALITDANMFDLPSGLADVETAGDLRTSSYVVCGGGTKVAAAHGKVAAAIARDAGVCGPGSMH